MMVKSNLARKLIISKHELKPTGKKHKKDVANNLKLAEEITTGYLKVSHEMLNSIIATFNTLFQETFLDVYVPKRRG